MLPCLKSKRNNNAQTILELFHQIPHALAQGLYLQTPSLRRYLSKNSELWVPRQQPLLLGTQNPTIVKGGAGGKVILYK